MSWGSKSRVVFKVVKRGREKKTNKCTGIKEGGLRGGKKSIAALEWGLKKIGGEGFVTTNSASVGGGMLRGILNARALTHLHPRKGGVGND